MVMAPLPLNNRGTVSVVVLGPDIVDFQWNNGCSSFRQEIAHGFLRGSTLLLRMNSDDAKIEIACELRENSENSVFNVTEVHGLHTGLTSIDDRMIDLHMLQLDAALRERMTRERWAGEKTFTDFECINVVTDMLRTLRPGWTVVFDEAPTGRDARPLLTLVLGSHITVLQDVATHVVEGRQRMVYM